MHVTLRYVTFVVQPRPALAYIYIYISYLDRYISYHDHLESHLVRVEVFFFFYGFTILLTFALLRIAGRSSSYSYCHRRRQSI